MKIVNAFKPLIIFTKELHLRCLTRSWIRLWRSNHLKGVLENRYSEICSQKPWKISMKKFIFSKVAGWAFYLIKKFVKIVFFDAFIAKNFREWDCATLLKRTSSKIFFKDFNWQFPLATFRTAVYRNIFFPEHLCGCFRTLFSSTRLLFILCF